MVTAIQPPSANRSDTATMWLRAVAAASFGGFVLPATATIGSPVHAAIWQGVVGAVVGALVAVIASRFARIWYLRPIGVVVAGVACWLLAQASYPVAAWLVAPVLGLGIAFAGGAALGADSRRAPVLGLVAAVAAAGCIVAVRFAVGRDAAMACGAAIVAAGAAASLLVDHPAVPSSGRRAALLAIGGPILALVTAAYIGATTPSVTWFGSLIHHGPRGGDEVAITFDDGPNPPYTLQISGILDQYGVKGTFFTVGKALDARPDVSKALLDDGHLLGNHSYTHDAFHWLDPAYAELGQTQDAFNRTLGVCPGLYRPPHGSHTPFMAKQVSDHGMKMVTWDVSAADWATNDGNLVARRVLDKVQAGSIILLHDGIDGNIGADRSVVLTALPLILEGLRERGLKPVTLDKLLGVPGYVDSC
jgi:peptidoglycan/xylan/chitin deacetylase (PgdA/CDA1 family)